MKTKLLLTAILAQFFVIGHAQIEFSTAEIEKMNNEIEIEAARLKDSLSANMQDGYANPELAIAFSIDTFKIEQMCAKKMEIDFSTSGMVHAIYEATAGYDKLLNKYYKELINKLSETDKEILKTAQRNWITYRDNEIKVIEMMSEEKYSGGGTIQRIFIAHRIQDLTKTRVLDLFDYVVNLAEAE